MSYYLESRSFRVRLPSQLYLNKTEGLCGNCNGHSEDDLHAPSGDIVKESEEFGLNWLVNKLLKEPPSGEENFCQALPQPECLPPPPEQDPCLKLLDDNAFKVEIMIVQENLGANVCTADLSCCRGPTAVHISVSLRHLSQEKPSDESVPVIRSLRQGMCPFASVPRLALA